MKSPEDTFERLVIASGAEETHDTPSKVLTTHASQDPSFVGLSSDLFN